MWAKRCDEPRLKVTPGQIAPGGFKMKLRLHIFEIAVSVIYLLIGSNYLLDTESGKRSPIGETLYPFDIAWSLGYVIAMPLVVFGIMRTSQRVRVSGLTLLGTATFMQFIAAVTIDPLEPRDFVNFVIAFSCFARALLAAETVKPMVTRRARS